MGDKHIDVKIKSWGNGSSSGPWVKFDLAGEDDLESLKSKVGEGFHMILVPIDSDEKPGQVYEDVTAPTPKKKQKLSTASECAIMLAEPNFWAFVNDQYRPFPNDKVKRVDNKDDADAWLKQHLNIESKTQLNDANAPVWAAYITVVNSLREWVNR